MERNGMWNRKHLSAVAEELKWHDGLVRIIDDVTKAEPSRRGLEIRADRGDGCVSGHLSTVGFSPAFFERLLDALRDLRTESGVRLAGMSMAIDPPIQQKEAAE